MLLYFQHSLPTTLYFYGDACLLFCFERALTITYTLAAALRSPFSLIQGCLTLLIAPRSCSFLSHFKCPMGSEGLFACPAADKLTAWFCLWLEGGVALSGKR